MINNAVLLYIVCIVTLLGITSCDRNNNLESYYYLDKGEALDVGYPYGAIVYKSPEEYLYRDVIIGGNVLAFKQNSKYIVAKQNLDIELLEKWIIEDIKSFIGSNGYNGERRELKFYNYVLPDTLLLKYDNSDSSISYLTNMVLKSSPVKKIRQNDTNYWIIQIANDSLIGPLTKSEFEITRKEMQIPDKLKLD